MKQLNINFSDVPSMEPLPAGRYPIVVASVQMLQSASSSNMRLSWALDVTEGEFSERRLFMNTSLAPKSLWFLRSLLEKFGMFQDSLDFKAEDDGTLIEPEFVGRVALAVVDQEEYQGVQRNRVTDLLPIEKVTSKPTLGNTLGGKAPAATTAPKISGLK